MPAVGIPKATVNKSGNNCKSCKMKKLVLVLASSVILAVSCSKEESIQRINEEIDLGFSGIDEGQLHNDLLSLFIDNWTQAESDETSILEEVHRILNSNVYEFSKNNNFDYAEFLKEANSCNPTTIKGDVNIVKEGYLTSIDISSDLKIEIDEFVKSLNSISGSEHVSYIKNMLLGRYLKQVKNLNEKDRALFGTMVDVAIHSAEFWLPSEQGGQNKFADFKNKLRTLREPNSIEFRGFWSDLILADAAGALTAAAISLVNSGGASAIPNPAFGGIPTAGVIAVIGGAGASITKAI